MYLTETPRFISESLRNLWNKWHKSFESLDKKWGDRPRKTDEFLSQASAYFDEADRLADGDPQTMTCVPFILPQGGRLLLILVLLATCNAIVVADSPTGGELLYNGIRLPKEWPPQLRISREPMPVPYLEKRPAVVPIDVGRQLFVDDFLVEKTTLQRNWHQAEPYSGNPVLRPDRPWETATQRATAYIYSDGVWYDPADQLFKLWYWGGYAYTTCYATSKDGIQWEKPSLDVVEPGTNVVLLHRHDSEIVWLDHDEADPQRRYKSFSVNPSPTFYKLRYSPDGISWSKPVATSPYVGDRSTVFYNPFRKVWVGSIRSGFDGRSRHYSEHPDAEVLVEKMPGLVPWACVDRLDPRNPNPNYNRPAPQLYNLDAVAYESLMLGMFAIWQGDPGARGGQKRNEILLGYSRDGFHWHRPDRRPFVGTDESDSAWNWGNVQSVGGGCLVVGDKLYFYHSGWRDKRSDSTISGGVAFLRRDGFASMDAGGDEGVLTTRPVRFSGKQLFVNLDADQGQFQAEILDESGNVIKPFTRSNCTTLSTDKTLVPITWKNADDLSALAGKTVRFRFYLTGGSLYAFWVSPDASGASHGYVAAGGPGFTGPTDTVGTAALQAAPKIPRGHVSTGSSRRRETSVELQTLQTPDSHEFGYKSHLPITRFETPSSDKREDNREGAAAPKAEPKIPGGNREGASVVHPVDIEVVPVGNLNNAGDPSGEGVGAVRYPFRIGKYEVTSGQYTAFLNAKAKSDPYGLYSAKMDADHSPYGCNIKRSGSDGNYMYRVTADWANRPVNYVSYWDAVRFCNWLHNGQGNGDTETGAYTLNGYNGTGGPSIVRNRLAKWFLPSEDEWYKAAYYDPQKTGGAGYYDYPTRNDSKPSNALSAMGTNNANYYHGDYTIGKPYYRTEVGAFKNSPSPFGTFDQGGNVCEWDEHIGYELSGYASRGLRGGAFGNFSSLLLSSTRDIETVYPTYEHHLRGFRVARPSELPPQGRFVVAWADADNTYDTVLTGANLGRNESHQLGLWAKTEKYGFTVRFHLPPYRDLVAQGDGTFTIYLYPDNPYTSPGSNVDGVKIQLYTMDPKDGDWVEMLASYNSKAPGEPWAAGSPYAHTGTLVSELTYSKAKHGRGPLDFTIPEAILNKALADGRIDWLVRTNNWDGSFGTHSGFRVCAREFERATMGPSLSFTAIPRPTGE